MFVSEWFPNLVDNDTTDEFVELYNSGDAAAKIDGYALGDGAKKKFSLAGYNIPPGSYLVLKKA